MSRGGSKDRFPPKWIGAEWIIKHGLHVPGYRTTVPERPRSPDSRSLSGQAGLLVAVNGLYAAANALSGLFVHVYLWKIKSDFTLIGWFAFFQQLASAVTFWLAGKWVKEHNKMNCLRLGIALNAFFYLSVLLLKTRSVDYVVWLGVIQGLSSGLFWLAYNVAYFEISNPNNRDRFNGMVGLLGAGSGMLAPWISGILITRMSAENGYRLIFTLSLFTFLVGVIVSFFLKRRKLSGRYAWTYAFKRLGEKGNSWRLIVPALVAQGVREGVFGFAVGILVYISTRSELDLGNYSLVTSAVSLVSFYVVGRLLKPSRRRWGMLVGAVMIAVVLLPFFWKMNYVTLLVFGIGVALFIPLYTIPLTSAVFDMIGMDHESARNRVEYVVLRELALNAGRMFGTLAFIVVLGWNTSQLTINLLMLGIGSSSVAAWWFMRNLLTARFAVEHRPESR